MGSLVWQFYYTVRVESSQFCCGVLWLEASFALRGAGGSKFESRLGIV